MIFSLLAVTVFLAAAIPLFCPMRITLHGLFSLEDIRLDAEFQPVFFPRIKIHSDKILAHIGKKLRQKEKTETPAQISFQKKLYKEAFRKTWKKISPHIGKILGRITTEKCTIDAQIGLSDAAATAVASGLMYGLLSLPFTLIRKFRYDGCVRLYVLPQYSESCVKIQAEGIFTLLPVHIIGVIIACFGSLLAFAANNAVKRLRARFTHFIKRKEA